MGPEIPIVTGTKKGVFRQGKALRKNTGANGEDDFSSKPQGSGLSLTLRTRNTFACGYGYFRFFRRLFFF